ncbi:ribonuclease H-like domain-containing protein [Tanacetum coccineum]|uniref:Ribonuclease H-like domain-containing protein n=1 Tax=Tanacetum coccineum TaxID=301880 RepID=A0ABQ5AK84_9ASTR
MVLVYGAKPGAELKVSCYANASFQTDKDDTRSQTGYVFVLNGGAVDWKSAKQSTTAMSSTEAEHIAVAEASMEAIWMRKFIDGLGNVVTSNKRPMEMICDNEPAIAIANDLGILKGARKFQRKYYYICEVAYLLIYVDDIVLTASSTNLLQRIISSLHKEFDMTDLGVLNYFLGKSVTRDSTDMFLSQKKYALELLDRAHMANCNPTWTSVDTESKLGSDGDPISDPTIYRSLAGGLWYLTFTRPDFSYAVQQVCLHMHDPREPHLATLKRVFRYVRGTLDFRLQLYASITGFLVAYTDAGWAGFPTTKRSTFGYCAFLGDNLLSWSAKRQRTLIRSSAEAEYRGVANVVGETVWLRNLLRELHTPLLSVTLVYYDNVSAIYMTVNPVQH